jgi:hypothetical protein
MRAHVKDLLAAASGRGVLAAAEKLHHLWPYRREVRESHQPPRAGSRIDAGGRERPSALFIGYAPSLTCSDH